MEVDRILYIFGSFTRKKQDKRKSFDQSSISAGNSPLRSPRIQRPLSQCLNIAPRTSAYEDGRKETSKEWECKLCKKELTEPRLLGCLHSFCTRCLQGLHQEGEAEVWSEVDVGSIQLENGESSGGVSAASGYESDLHNSESEDSLEQKPHKYGILTRKVSGKSVQFLLCPICGYETPLPLGGISALPLNYVLLRKMMAAEKERNKASILCDLCNSDTKAESRCSQCLVSLCSSCVEAHHRQKATSRHSLHPLDPLPVKFCSQHPKAELSVYCATCQQVICRDCCIISHSGHALANASRAAAERARLLRDACERARLVPENVERATRILDEEAFESDESAARVEREVCAWAERYVRAVSAHARAVRAAAARARHAHRARMRRRRRALRDRALHAHHAVNFAEELLSEAKEDELLSLSGAVLRRLERLTELQYLSEVPKCELRFAPTAPAAHDPTLVGRLLTQAPDPDKCVLNTDGLQDLQVGCQHEVILELRDSNGERIWCGGEQVAGFVRRRDARARPTSAISHDRGDGSYALAFTPPSPGGYLLAVTVNNRPVKGSPFACAARVAKPHTGVFHCCAFCSSGGRRDAVCACGATMPGGYKGCGHGHAGWPGARHWSCCGRTLRAAPCSPLATAATLTTPSTTTATTATTPAPSAALYQFSL
ncbi:tripartite motif-containing protein 45 isoform X2 [Galleria mellonella]|uniref:Tripartite motif-containing protein 45 isoform X2 n=1 Tax=Galleria mellonella TaxID=7137 RepID=A0ABM3N2V6_GALME|nr:tripartite motif-containing protein 45 isoform X2 [Galleria mellonella]